MHCQQAGRCNRYSILVHQTSKCCFIFSRSRVAISARSPGFQDHLDNCGHITSKQAKPLPYMSLPIQYLLLNGIESELVSRKKSTQTSKQTNKQQTLYSMQSNSCTVHNIKQPFVTLQCASYIPWPLHVHPRGESLKKEYNNLPLLYSFVRGRHEDGHVKAAACRRHVVNWQILVECC